LSVQTMTKGVVFDFDGTLTELTLDFNGMRNELEKVILKYVSLETLWEFEDRLMLELIYAIERRLGHRGAAFRDEAFTLLRSIEVEAAGRKEVYPFTRQVLRSLREMGVKLGVMTRNCMGAVRKTFPDIDEFVDVTVTREDVRVVKPDPSHPRAVLNRLRVDPSEALLVGDHPTDIEAGWAVGARTVGVLSGRTKHSDMERAGADFVADDIRQVPVIIRGTATILMSEREEVRKAAEQADKPFKRSGTNPRKGGIRHEKTG
jgi:phosphoglycolate phosphatase